MNRRLIKKKIRNLVEKTVRTVQLNVEVGVQETGINMSYDFIQDKVYFDQKRVQQARLEMPFSVTLQKYIMTLTLHELGHSIDRNSLLEAMPRMIEIARAKRKKTFAERREDLQLFTLDMECHEMDIEFERTAWAHARQLNDRYHLVDNNTFNLIEIHSMSSYLKYYEKDMITYKKLLAADRMNTLEVPAIPLSV